MARQEDIGLELYDNADVYSQSVTPNVTSSVGDAGFAITIGVQDIQKTPERCHSSLKRAVTRSMRRVSLFFAFHILNSVFGVAAFATTVVGLVLSVALLPLCGFGVIVFQALAVVTEKMAWFDVAIANLLIDDKYSEKLLRVHPGIRVSEFAVSDREPADTKVNPTLSSNIAIFKVMVYFATAKPVVTALSWIMVAFVMSFPIIAFSESRAPALTMYERECAEKLATLVLTGVGIFTLSIVLLVLLAMLSRELTELVCADTVPTEISEE